MAMLHAMLSLGLLSIHVSPSSFVPFVSLLNFAFLNEIPSLTERCKETDIFEHGTKSP